MPKNIYSSPVSYLLTAKIYLKATFYLCFLFLLSACSERKLTGVEVSSIGTFEFLSNLQADVTPHSVLAIDINNDNYDDVVVAQLGSATIGVFENNTDGTFATRVDIPAGNSPNYLASGDFDEDGFLDIVVSNSWPDLDNTLSVILNNGDGTFAAPTPYSAGGNPGDVVVADFDGDNNLDLATRNNYDSFISVFYGNGDGTFDPETQISTSADSQTGIVTGLFDGDALIDIAITNYSTNEVLLFLNDLITPFGSESVLTSAASPQGALSADFDNNGFDDILSFSTTETSLLLSDGVGSFSAAPAVDSINPYIPCIADVNADGNQDIIAAQPADSEIKILIGGGNGTFTDGEVISNADATGGRCGAGDFNNDGIIDFALVGASDKVILYLGND